MWSKHQSTFQDHIKHTHNSIVENLRVSILQYPKWFHEMHDIDKYLPSNLKKGDIFN